MIKIHLVLFSWLLSFNIKSIYKERITLEYLTKLKIKSDLLTLYFISFTISLMDKILYLCISKH
ncbi:hypothetical protein KL86DYS1_30343 [uncultured Dysgonomonas sp.]|uniref:Uncharacterized protein n=1 Tax=uncultured Dysgonomonas sp. TaxID=206096 RepID=A0A212JT70_9BACT|nr:hypothetical protein KL86DYS1_30343 [uncultured Dysgonomonas sp.]